MNAPLAGYYYEVEYKLNILQPSFPPYGEGSPPKLQLQNSMKPANNTNTRKTYVG